MARGQQPIDFVWCEFCSHLKRCGRTELQAKLAALVRRDGDARDVDGESMKVLTISSRQAAALLKCNDRSVRDAAATLARFEWFHELRSGAGKPTTYVLNELVARSLEPVDELDQLRATAGQCGPLRGSAESSPCSENKPNTKPVFKPQTNSDERPAVARTTPHHSAPLRTLSAMPWRMGETSDLELVAAVRGRDRRLLRHLFDHAVRMNWIAGCEDNWLKFLTGCHHAATARLARRMGVLVMFTKNGLNVSRMTQASDQWAADMIRDEHRDPELVRLGRSMQGADDE